MGRSRLRHRTRRRHARLQADIAELDPRTVVDGGTGLIASPPCPGFSMAGKGGGRRDSRIALDAVEGMGSGRNIGDELAWARALCEDERSALVLEPLRWALTLTPTWLAWEQVPAVLPLWEACAHVLRAHGWHVWTGNVQAEQYGVPQTRKRAILLAHRDRAVDRPKPTHSRYYPRTPDKLDPGVLPWVSMAEALGRPAVGRLRSNYSDGSNPGERGYRLLSQPSPCITSKVGHWEPVAANAGTTEEDMAWTRRRPSPTIVGSFCPDVVAAPGYRGPGDGPRQKARGSVRVTVEEAAALQSFPAGYPWRGRVKRDGEESVGDKYRQVGDAVPPLLAAHCLAALGVGSLAHANAPLANQEGAA